jgi:hypothetical protein
MQAQAQAQAAAMMAGPGPAQRPYVGWQLPPQAVPARPRHG